MKHLMETTEAPTKGSRNRQARTCCSSCPGQQHIAWFCSVWPVQPRQWQLQFRSVELKLLWTADDVLQVRPFNEPSPPLPALTKSWLSSLSLWPSDDNHRINKDAQPCQCVCGRATRLPILLLQPEMETTRIPLLTINNRSRTGREVPADQPWRKVANTPREVQAGLRNRL